jgi:hypothetical protein
LKSFQENAVVAIGAVLLDEKSDCESSDYVKVVETNIKGDEKETTICKNKVSLTGPGTWFSAKKVCVHYVTNDVSAKNGRIIQFNGGLMTKDAYKDVKKKSLKTRNGRKSIEEIMAEMAAMMRTRDRCHIATNKMTKPMMKMMSLEDKQNKDANKKKKKDKNSSGKKDKKKKKKNKN